MDKKNFVVFGGSKGIGLAIVNKLIKNGHDVTAVSRTNDLIPVVSSIKHVKCDLAEETLNENQLPDVIDGLVYCPGSIVLKPFKSISDKQFLEDFNINCLGAVRSIKAGLNGLKKSQYQPSIVLFSTVAVTQGMPFHSSIAMAKGAIEGLTRSLAAELAPGIRVNCVAPSLTNTELASKLLSSQEKIFGAEQRHPLKSIGNPEDLADMAYFLLSSEAKWITGQVMHVDGGMSALKV